MPHRHHLPPRRDLSARLRGPVLGGLVRTRRLQLLQLSCGVDLGSRRDVNQRLLLPRGLQGQRGQLHGLSVFQQRVPAELGAVFVPHMPCEPEPDRQRGDSLPVRRGVQTHNDCYRW